MCITPSIPEPKFEVQNLIIDRLDGQPISIPSVTHFTLSFSAIDAASRPLQILKLFHSNLSTSNTWTASQFFAIDIHLDAAQGKRANQSLAFVQGIPVSFVHSNTILTVMKAHPIDHPTTK
jgi:hypothetical protein